MDLPTIWFLLIGVLLTGYAVLDGFDLGAGMLHLVVARTEAERRTVIAAIAPVWDGNEVWLLTAGGALFAAFPLVYATAFSGFYLALVLVLLGLIFRALAVELRDHETSAAWRARWDVVFSVASLVPAVLFGVAIGNVLAGLPLDAEGVYRGGLFGLLSPFTLVCGVTSAAMFVMQGGAWLTMKTRGDLQRRARAATGAAAVVLVALWAVATLLGLDIPRRHDLLGTAGALAAPAVVVLAIALLLWSVRAHRDGIAFAASSLAIAGLLAIVGLSLYPDVLPAADPSRSLTVTGAASSDLTLSVMLVVALIGMPLVIAYTAFVYLRFRGAASSEETAY